MDDDSPSADRRTKDHDATPDDRTADDTENEDVPSLRQRLHWATGDRDREAKAVADRAPDEVTEEDAKVAVNRAHGDSPEAVPTDGSLATTDDAHAVSTERDRSQET